MFQARAATRHCGVVSFCLLPPRRSSTKLRLKILLTSFRLCRFLEILAERLTHVSAEVTLQVALQLVKLLASRRYMNVSHHDDVMSCTLHHVLFCCCRRALNLPCTCLDYVTSAPYRVQSHSPSMSMAGWCHFCIRIGIGIHDQYPLHVWKQKKPTCCLYPLLVPLAVPLTWNYPLL